MRKNLLGLSVLIILLFASCADADVYYGLNDTHTITQQYAVHIDNMELTARSYADSIKSFWENKGLSADIELLDESLLIIGDSANIYDSRETAVNSFSDLLTADDSLLTNVVFEYTPSYEVDAFYLRAFITIDDVIRQNEIQDIPDQDLEELLKSAQNGTYTFCISLPGEVEFTNADEIDGQKCTWNLVYGDTVLIELQTKIFNTENILAYEQLTRTQSQSDMFVRIGIAAAGALVLALVLIFVIRRVRNKRV
jgi:hypothetical protein